MNKKDKITKMYLASVNLGCQFYLQGFYDKKEDFRNAVIEVLDNYIKDIENLKRKETK